MLLKLNLFTKIFTENIDFTVDIVVLCPAVVSGPVDSGPVDSGPVVSRTSGQ